MPTTHPAHPWILLALCALTLTACNRSPLVAAKSCEADALAGDLEDAALCLSDIVNAPFNAANLETYELYHDDAIIIVFTSPSKSGQTTGAGLRKRVKARQEAGGGFHNALINRSTSKIMTAEVLGTHVGPDRLRMVTEQFGEVTAVRTFMSDEASYVIHAFAMTDFGWRVVFCFARM